ncbi:YecH family metal-binding protein [Endozoicomonas sp. OPT23]|uniref:YecH family metal-binding protein n=1 Tax=Endozoicomonas sp. OPT23 TaxID=2072845 RepID=UPI001890DEC1|nr:YecH family metal-binding protein [Endozoicomonas sp. OPT23]
MQDSIHGRNVLNLIQEMPQPISTETLMSAINESFGTEAKFHTCSIKGASANELIEMFITKGKLNQDESGIHFVGCGCGHH